MVLNSLMCADVPLRNYSLTHSLGDSLDDTTLPFCLCPSHLIGFFELLFFPVTAGKILFLVMCVFLSEKLLENSYRQHRETFGINQRCVCDHVAKFYAKLVQNPQHHWAKKWSRLMPQQYSAGGHQLRF